MLHTPPKASLWQRSVSALWRMLLLAGATLLMLGALLVGLLLASSIVLWALLRGRRPAPMDLSWGRMRGGGGLVRPVPGEVVDVQVREVPEPPPR